MNNKNENDNEILNKYKKEILKLKNELKEISIKDNEKQNEKLLNEIEILKNEKEALKNEKEIIFNEKNDAILKYKFENNLNNELNSLKVRPAAKKYILNELKDNIRINNENNIEIFDKEGNILRLNNENATLKTYLEKLKNECDFFFENENEAAPALDIKDNTIENNNQDEDYYNEIFIVE